MSSRPKLKFDFLVDMQGTRFNVPRFHKVELKWIIERLGFHGFCLLLFSRNTNVFFKRQVVEELWALILRHAAKKENALHPYDLVQNNEGMLLAMFQIEGCEGFDVERFWLDQAAEAARKGHVLDISSTFNIHHSCIPMTEIMSFDFEEYGVEMKSQYITEQMQLCDSFATEFEHKYYEKHADKEWWNLVVPAVKKESTEDVFYFDDCMEIDIENDDVGDPTKMWLLPEEKESQVLALRTTVPDQIYFHLPAKVTQNSRKRKATTWDYTQYRKLPAPIPQIYTIDQNTPLDILAHRPRV